MAVYIDPTLNSIEVMQVVEDMRKYNIKDYRLAHGNNCIWATYGMVSAYYIFRNGKIHTVQVD